MDEIDEVDDIEQDFDEIEGFDNSLYKKICRRQLKLPKGRKCLAKVCTKLCKGHGHAKGECRKLKQNGIKDHCYCHVTCKKLPPHSPVKPPRRRHAPPAEVPPVQPPSIPDAPPAQVPPAQPPYSHFSYLDY
uniref:Uncharacterized protein n=1 Tax=Kalanchoe fedtschenkoi TaxID=63787 RepID=A0A7N0UI49_KALFE